MKFRVRFNPKYEEKVKKLFDAEEKKSEGYRKEGISERLELRGSGKTLKQLGKFKFGDKDIDLTKSMTEKIDAAGEQSFSYEIISEGNIMIDFISIIDAIKKQADEAKKKRKFGNFLTKCKGAFGMPLQAFIYSQSNSWKKKIHKNLAKEIGEENVYLVEVVK